MTAGKGKATVKLKKVGGSGVLYQIAYRMGSQKWENVSSTGVSKTIDGLSGGKQYAFRVRPFQKVNGKVYYGKWSKVVKAKIKT